MFLELACGVFTFMFEYLNQLSIALLLTVPSCVIRLPTELYPESPVGWTFLHIISYIRHSFVSTQHIHLQYVCGFQY
jgi:hypothetical protein